MDATPMVFGNAKRYTCRGCDQIITNRTMPPHVLTLVDPRPRRRPRAWKLCPKCAYSFKVAITSERAPMTTGALRVVRGMLEGLAETLRQQQTPPG